MLSPANPTFAKPVLARLTFGPKDTAGSSGAALAIAFHQPDGWYSLGDGLLDPGRRTLTVALSGGGPGASARRALGFFDGQIAILQAWEITPKTAAVFAGGTAHFSAYYAGPPSTIPCVTPFCYAKLTSPYGVDVQWTVEGTSAAGSVSPSSGTSTTYTAPCNKSRTFTVLFWIGIPGLPGLSKPYPNGRAQVSVYARNWQLTMEQKHTALCPTGFFMNWTSRAVDQYSVQDGGGAVAGLRRVDGNGIFNALESCLTANGCTWNFVDDWPLLTIDEVTGALDRQSGGMVFTVSYTEEAKIVGYTATCSGHTSDPVLTEPGLSYTTGDLILAPSGGSRRVPDNDTNYVQWTFTPLSSCN